MTFFVVYDRATKPAKSCQPGAKALMAWCLANTTATNLGCYVNRPIRGGSSLSVHAEGRALDLGFPSREGGTPAGWNLAHRLVAAHRDLGVQYVIYARRQWLATKPGWRSYSGASAHNEHIHVELNRAAAQALTADMITEALGGQPMTEQQTEAVRQIQQTLIDLGYELPKFGADGDPGPETLAAFASAMADLERLAQKVDEQPHDDKAIADAARALFAAVNTR